jgi:predicted DNA-binding transcriptional regulator AlpA
VEETRYLNEKQVAEITGRALSTLRNERSQGKGIPYIKVGRSIRYDYSDVVKFMDAHKVMTDCSIFLDSVEHH